MEPYEIAEEQEREWDKTCEAAPHCDCCGNSIYPYDTYVQIDGHMYCERCVRGHTYYTDDLEV